MSRRNDVIGAVARGWCHIKNSHKTMDSDLAMAIVEEVMDIDPLTPINDIDEVLGRLYIGNTVSPALLDSAIEQLKVLVESRKA